MGARSFFVADGTALVTVTAIVVTVGYGLGVAEETAGPWLAAVGALGLVALSAALTWYLWHLDDDPDAQPER
jgi:membrane protein DedA with SNARE-associated domain